MKTIEQQTKEQEQRCKEYTRTFKWCREYKEEYCPKTCEYARTREGLE